jgi:hypothetical protein
MTLAAKRIEAVSLSDQFSDNCSHLFEMKLH